MVVRDRVGRKRYIAFAVLRGGDRLSRGGLDRAVRSRMRELGVSVDFDLTVLESGRGIVRTDHRSARALVDVLNSLSFEQHGLDLRTLRTSGTIRSLKRRYFSGDEERGQ